MLHLSKQGSFWPDMKKNVLIIGAGGVAQVVAHKCAQHNDVLGDIHIASRTASKCQAIIDSIHEKKNLKNSGVLEGHALDATDVDATAALIEKNRRRDRHQCRICLHQHAGHVGLHQNRCRLSRYRHP